MIFSAADAAFEGFRVTRRHPVAVLAWAAVMLVANVASGLALGLIAGSAWGQFELLTTGTPTADTVPQLAALMPRVAPAVFVSTLIQILGAGVVNASVLRALLRPERSATLRLGRDELRVVGLFAMFFAASFAATIALSVLVGGLAALLGPAVVSLAPVASLAAFLILGIRFSLAGPMTIAEHRFRFRESWIATRRWFWPLFSAEALAAALAMVVAFLGVVMFAGVAGAVVLGTGGALADMATLFEPDFSAPGKLLQLAPLLWVAWVSVLYALVLVILVGPPVELYRLTREGAEPAA